MFLRRELETPASIKGYEQGIKDAIEICDNYLEELKNNMDNANSIIFGINGHKLHAIMEIQKRLQEKLEGEK